MSPYSVVETISARRRLLAVPRVDVEFAVEVGPARIPFDSS